MFRISRCICWQTKNKKKCLGYFLDIAQSGLGQNSRMQEKGLTICEAWPIEWWSSIDRKLLKENFYKFLNRLKPAKIFWISVQHSYV